VIAILMLSAMSFIKMGKRRGPTIDICGAPEGTPLQSEANSPNTVL